MFKNKYEKFVTRRLKTCIVLERERSRDIDGVAPDP
jgi:hypothetical protein